MQTLNALAIPLSGHNLIQASAGTGKTWTLSLLYLRLLLEQSLTEDNELTVDQLLVVTYTRAATDELRERIRSRLKTAVQLYEAVLHAEQHGKKPATTKAAREYHQLLACYPATRTRLWLLQRALLNFDEAAVFTIHGFCQRALQEHAFEVGLPFETELVSDESELLRQLADQFWQQHLADPDPLNHAVLKHFLFPKKLTPDTLLASVQDFIGKPYLTPVLDAPVDAQALLTLEQALQQTLTQIHQSWTAEQADIMGLLASEVMKNSSYGAKQLADLRTAMQTLLEQEHPYGLEKYLVRFTPEAIEKGTKVRQQPPQHPFFPLMQALLEQATQREALLQAALDQLHYRLLEWLRTELPQHKQQSGQLAYDDLLVQLEQALRLRPALAHALSRRYQVALIDEFQDTDPIQYHIFATIYRDQGRVFYVGDPKQAIYSFRGADIHTYLQAANAVAPERQYTLDRNFRSSPELINALNTLFEQAPDPFRNQHRIGYEHVQCGGTVKNRLRTPAPMAPLRIWDWDRLDETINATTVMQKVAQAVADDIARLLQLGQQGKARIGKHPVSSGDFAVLVRSHRQGRLIKQALQHNGIASVQKSPIGIFETDEATELRLVLTAVAEGSHTGRIHRAWVTELMGGTAQDLLDFEHHPERFDQVLEHFLQLQQLWQEHGIMRMLRSWMQHFQVRENLLRYVDGERRLTNLLHLAEILHRESRTESLGMHATLRWLRQRAQASRSSTDEDHQLRLESDEHLVQIVTIHKSKGLQYPLVYCPFLWRTPGNRSDKNDWFSWHDAASGDNCLQAGQYRREEAVASHQAEEQGEDARLLYVALTRAQYQCTIGMTSGLVKKADNHSALSWLLFGHLPEAEAIMAAVAKNGMPATERQQLMQQAIQQLQRRSADSISYQGLPDAGAVHYRAPEDRQLLMSRQFSGRIAPVPRLSSFSGLVSGRHDERPDHDLGQILLQTRPHRERDLAVFPAGQQAGVCLHKMLEELDFQAPLVPQRATVIEPALLASGFETEWRTAAETLLTRTLQAPLLPEGHLKLADIGHEARLDELEFYFPVECLRPETLQQVLRQYLPHDRAMIRMAVAQLSFKEVRGYMKGYVDLVFRHQGRFYLVDYKSNRLGENGSDYTPEVLEQAMADAHYYLQYLIYCVALHRYLGQRLADYDWERDVGGVLYLFLRGMHPEHPARGVFFHKPSRELIEALDGLMGAVNKSSRF